VNAVVFDLELIKRFRKGQPSEIVEIGACKVDLNSRQIIDQFQIYISPRKGYIAKSTRNFINMSKKDMQSAVPFREGIRQFVEWLGSDYYLCSWGKDDRIHLIDECIRKKVGLGWLRNYNDIQQQIGALLREDNRNQLGLQNALELAHIEPTGLAHRGIDDAINTARLLIHLLDRIKLQRNEVTDKEIAQFKLRLQRKRQERKKLLNQANQKARTTASESLDTEPS
jgi:inhibitor of KinA sporulation pathway (predicted exonuclease)